MTVPDPIAETSYGLLSGERRPAGTVYRSVPYAAPLSGGARFAGPRPPDSWAGVRRATRPGPTAPAADRRTIGSLDISPVIGPGWIRGEDYLSLTVWTPGTAGDRLPVLVFIHGGGFVSGSHHAEVLAGDAFMADRVVLVTVTYRLGIAGWLDLPGAPANRGLRDVIAALHWVRHEIGAFGGDPQQVTLAGQSAGAMIVAALLASPLAAGLFRRAISASGNADNAQSPSTAARVTSAAAHRLGVSPDVDGFSTVSDSDLVAVTQRLHAAELGIPNRGAMPGAVFGLVLDPPTLPRQPVDVVRDAVGQHVDLLVGSTADESHVYLVPIAPPDQHVDPATAATTTDSMFAGSTRRLADAHAREPQGKTYTYEFTWRSDAFGGRLGACHCVDLPFVFGTYDRPSLRGPTSLLGTAAPDPQSARTVHRHWVDFVRCGDPGWTEHTVRAPYRALVPFPKTVTTPRENSPHR